ncbi:MAG: hypothetical protein ACPIOQ_47655, partial [Promethearchaeia archaeon]
MDACTTSQGAGRRCEVRAANRRRSNARTVLPLSPKCRSSLSSCRHRRTTRAQGGEGGENIARGVPVGR